MATPVDVRSLTVLFKRTVRSPRPLALPTAVNSAAVADVAVRLAKEMRERVGRAETLNRRLGHDLQARGDDRRGHRHVEPIRHPHGREHRELTDRGVDRVDGRHDVLSPAEQLRVVMREDGGDPLQIEAFDRVEREPLRREPERHAAQPDSLGALGQDGPEALGRAVKDADAGVELIGEPRGWRRQRNRHQLTDQCGAELAEVRLEVAVEMSRVGLFARQGGLAVDDETVWSEQIREQRCQVLDGRRQIVRFLGRGVRADGQQEHERQQALRSSSRDVAAVEARLSTDLADDPRAAASNQRHRLLRVNRLLPAAGVDRITPLQPHRRFLIAPVDGKNRDRDALGGHGAEPLFDPPLFLGGHVRLDRPKQRQILRFDGAHIRRRPRGGWPPRRCRSPATGLTSHDAGTEPLPGPPVREPTAAVRASGRRRHDRRRRRSRRGRRRRRRGLDGAADGAGTSACGNGVCAAGGGVELGRSAGTGGSGARGLPHRLRLEAVRE